MAKDKQPMTIERARKEVEKAREDLMWVASQIQNKPEAFAKALAEDETTRKELKTLVGDLFSLAEVVVSDAVGA